jgi:hypothetical protein
MTKRSDENESERLADGTQRQERLDQLLKQLEEAMEISRRNLVRLEILRELSER